MEKSASSAKHQSTTVSARCQICGDSAKYSSYGVLSCQACKMFFKRTAAKGLEAFKCTLDGHCDIDLSSRHVCSSCRLRKCIASGMQIEMIRGPRTSQQGKRKLSSDSVRRNKLEQFPTLNLLQADRSSLTVEQWNRISNLSHCFDEHSAFRMGEKFLHEQNSLPIKIRFKCGTSIAFFRSSLEKTPSLYQNNRDFLTLTADDRSVLLESTFAHTGLISASLMYHQIGLYDYPTFYNAIELATSPRIASAVKCTRPLYNFDWIVMKLLLAILSFSTTTYTCYSSHPPKHLSNMKQVLAIQDAYTELLWRYLVYRHGFKQAVMCFSDFIKYLFLVHHVVVLSQDVQWFTEEIDSLVVHTEETLTLS